MRLSQVLVIAVASFLFASDTAAVAISNQAKISKMVQSNPSQRLLRSHKYFVEEDKDQSEDSGDVKKRGFATQNEEDLEERAPLSPAQIDKLETIARGWGTSWTNVAMGRSSVSIDKVTALLKLRDALIESKSKAIAEANALILRANKS